MPNDLKPAIAKAKVKPQNYRFIKGSKSNHLLITPRPPKPLAIKEIQNECGSGKVAGKGTCFFQDGKMIFTLRGEPPSSMEMLIRRQISEDAGMTLKVEIRSLRDDEPDEVSVEEALSPEESPTGGIQSGEPAPVPEPQAPSPSPEAPAPSPELVKLKEAMAKLALAAAAAVKANPALQEDVEGFIVAFKRHIDANEATEARESLFELGALLKRQGARQEGSMPTGGLGKVKFEQLHLQWEGAKKTVGADLDALHNAILAEFDDGEAQTAAGNLNNILAQFNEGLGDTLDQLRNTALTERGPLAKKALDIAQRYLSFLQSSELVAHVAQNPFGLATDVSQKLEAPLQQLAAQLQPLV